MPDRTFDILIDIQARVQAIQDASNKMQQLTQHAQSFNEAMKTGFGIDLAHRFIEAIQEIPKLLAEGVKKGIEFNALLETSQKGIAGVLRQFDPGQFNNWNTALNSSGHVIDLLQEKANKLGLSFDSMLEQYRTTAGALFAGGVRDLQKQVDLTVLLQQAMAAVGVPEYLRQRDIIDLLQGRASRTIAGRALGITDAEIKQAADAGNIYGFLTDRFKELANAGAEIGNTGAAGMQRFRNEIQQLEGIGTRELFQALTADLNALNRTLASGQTAEGIRAIGAAIATVHDVGRDFITVGGGSNNWFVEAAKTVTPWGQITAYNQMIWNYLKGSSAAAQELLEREGRHLENIRAQIGAAQTTKEQSEARKALDTEISYLLDRQKDSTGKVKDAVAVLLGYTAKWKADFDAIAGKGDQIAGSMKYTAEQIDEIVKRYEAVQGVQSEIDLTRAKVGGDPYAELETRLATLRDTTFNKIVDAGGDPVQAARLAEQLVDLKRQEGEEQIRLNSAKDDERDITREIIGLEHQEAAILRDIRGQQQIIAQNTLLAADSKQGAMHELLLRERDALGQLIQQYQKYIAAHQAAAASDDVEKQKLDELVNKLKEAQVQYELLGFKIQTSTFSGGLQSDLANWVNGFGTSAHQIAGIIEGTINASLQGTNQLLLDSVFRTGDWRQTLVGVERQILNLFLTWIEQMALQRGAALLGITTTTAAQSASNATVATTAAPAAAASTGASWGTNWLVGGAIAIAAIAAIIAALTAFHEGGIVGSGRSRRGRSGPMSDDEQLILALENEGLFTEEQMQNLLPTNTSVFSNDQLQALGGDGSGPTFYGGPTIAPGTGTTFYGGSTHAGRGLPGVATKRHSGGPILGGPDVEPYTFPPANMATGWGLTNPPPSNAGLPTNPGPPTGPPLWGAGAGGVPVTIGGNQYIVPSGSITIWGGNGQPTVEIYTAPDGSQYIVESGSVSIAGGNPTVEINPSGGPMGISPSDAASATIYGGNAAIADFYAANAAYGAGGWYYDASGNPVQNPNAIQYVGTTGPISYGSVPYWQSSNYGPLSSVSGMPSGFGTFAQFSSAVGNSIVGVGGFVPSGSVNSQSAYTGSGLGGDQVTYGAGEALVYESFGTHSHIGAGPSHILQNTRAAAIRPHHSGGPLVGGSMGAEYPYVGLVGEFMHPIPAVAKYGMPFMEAVRNLSFPVERTKFHTGGLLGSFAAPGGGRESAAPVIQVLAFTNIEDLQDAIVNSDANKIFIVDTVKGRAHEVGITT